MISKCRNNLTISLFIAFIVAFVVKHLNSLYKDIAHPFSKDLFTFQPAFSKGSSSADKDFFSFCQFLCLWKKVVLPRLFSQALRIVEWYA